MAHNVTIHSATTKMCILTLQQGAKVKRSGEAGPRVVADWAKGIGAHKHTHFVSIEFQQQDEILFRRCKTSNPSFVYQSSKPTENDNQVI